MLSEEVACFDEAAVLPEKWPYALDRLARMAGGACGALLVATPRQCGGDADLQFVANEQGSQLINDFANLE